MLSRLTAGCGVVCFQTFANLPGCRRGGSLRSPWLRHCYIIYIKSFVLLVCVCTCLKSFVLNRVLTILFFQTRNTEHDKFKVNFSIYYSIALIGVDLGPLIQLLLLFKTAPITRTVVQYISSLKLSVTEKFSVLVTLIFLFSKFNKEHISSYPIWAV